MTEKTTGPQSRAERRQAMVKERRNVHQQRYNRNKREMMIIKGVSIALNVDSVAEAERVFNVLSEGGHVIMPLGQTFWAARFGMFVDRFGVSWMVNCDKGG